MDASRDFFFFFSPNEQRAGGEGALPDFLRRSQELPKGDILTEELPGPVRVTHGIRAFMSVLKAMPLSYTVT